MSSATSTKGARSDAVSGDGVREANNAADALLQPWQFFVLAGLGCATAATYLARGQGVAVIILLAVLMGSTVLVGLAVLRTVRPLVSPQQDRTVMIGQRTRAALEREKTLTLRSIKELEFDRAMGKLSESDWHEMSTRLRARAARLIRQLDAGSGYREQIERDLAKRLGTPNPTPVEAKTPLDPGDGNPTSAGVRPGERVCASCSTPNDPDARFCKACGSRL